jgi:hypothetical protein
MIQVNKGDRYLVLQHNIETGERITAGIFEGDICPSGDNHPEHAVLTEILGDGKLGFSIRVFPPDYQDGKIPIVRTVTDSDPVFIESTAKISR